MVWSNCCYTGALLHQLSENVNKGGLTVVGFVTLVSLLSPLKNREILFFSGWNLEATSCLQLCLKTDEMFFQGLNIRKRESESKTDLGNLRNLR